MRDLRFAIRMLLKRPGFAWVVVFTLALGIGATSAVFSLIDGVLLTAPPYRQPEQLVLIASARAEPDPALGPPDWAAAQWLEWPEEATSSFDAVAGYRWTFNFRVSEEGSESLQGMWVSEDYFDVTGLEPVLGRGFQDSDAVEGAAPVIVVGHELWQGRFAGDPEIVGKPFRMSRRDTPPTIIGVMPPAVRFLPSRSMAQEPNYDVDARVDFWIPVVPNPELLKAPIFSVVGRLRPGVDLDSAQAELEVVTARQARAEPDYSGVVPQVQSLGDVANRDGRRILLPLLGAAALVLMIACGNAAALMLVRGLQRQQEYGVRSALGAGRGALIRQVGVESLLLALLGGAFGIGIAIGIVQLFRVVGAHAIPRLDAVSIGWPVLACGLASAVVSALGAGLFPALRASQLDPVHALKAAGPRSSAGRGERRWLSVVTMMQTALTLTLLVGAALLMRTMYNLSQVTTGFDTGRILTMSVTAVQGDWADFHLRALEQVSGLAGVRNAAFAWGVPLTGNNWPGAIELEGQPVASRPSDRLRLPLRSVTPGYFDLLGLEVLEGRDFNASDTDEAPNVAIVNQAFAERYFPDANPLGKQLWRRGRDQPAARIVGVVASGRTDDVTRAAVPEIYLSLWQARAFSKHLVIRTDADPRAVAGAVQAELRGVDPTVAVESVQTLDQIRGDSLAAQSFAMRLLIGFASVASILTLGGIYGVLSLSVVSRRREIAIRTALGAERRSVLGLVFGEGVRLIAGGTIVGLAAAIGLSRVLESFLFEIEPTDPVTLIGAALLFTGAALLACWVPARRAASVDPITALRAE